MKINIKSELKTIMSNPDSKFNYFGWPSVARLQNGKIAVVASGYRMGHICPFGKCVMALSDDNGETYTGAFPIIDTYLDDRDGGICTFGENGVIVSSFNNTRAQQKSWNPVSDELNDFYFKRNTFYHAYLDTVTDKDETKYWGSTFRMSFDGGKTFGKIFKSPVTSPHGPIELKSGKIIWIGTTFKNDPDNLEGTQRIKAYEIKPDGSTEHIGTVPPVYSGNKFLYSCEPHTVELPDGKLLCHIRMENGVFTIYQSISEDGGKTWSEPKQLLEDFGGSPPHLLLHSSGTLICTYGFRNKPFGVKVMFSKDMGKTWDTYEYFIYNNGGNSSDLGYPASIELDNGDILTVFYAKDEAKGPATIKQIIWNFEK
ncbi:MAG: exo-alpha-sialidase [Clostridia bacterium]|nr:exo-alpha-sialidase [Clostridia bacterium]